MLHDVPDALVCLGLFISVVAYIVLDPLDSRIVASCHLEAVAESLKGDSQILVPLE